MIVRVPATSANMGPGFDALGMALTLWAEIGLFEDHEPDGQVGGLPEGAHLADEHHPAAIAFGRAGGDGRLWVKSPIPMGRGLGYSAAMRVGGLVLGYKQRHPHVDDVVGDFRDEVLVEATLLEGHADNAAPALLGGVVASTGQRSMQIPLGFDPAVVVWVPSFSTRTDQSRGQLNSTVPMTDAVFNIGRTAFLVATLVAGEVDALRHATQDALHQPIRFAGSPASRAAYDAALAAGAWCAWLSGSGPTVAALCDRVAADAVAAALPSDGHAKILDIDHAGTTIHA